MNYPRRFFDLNLLFAHKVAEVSGQSFDSALLHYTNLYIRFGLGWDLSAANPVWQEYLSGLNAVADRGEWTYHFYLNRQPAVPAVLQLPFGCFSYDVVDGGRIRLHFHNTEPAGCSPLSKDCMSHRLAELKNMFAHVKQAVSIPTTVIGASWLYNLEAYRRLFPPAYLATSQVGEDDFAYLPLWGQFINHRGQINEERVEQFLLRLDRQHDCVGLAGCFPFQVLHLESSIEDFYSFYGV